MEDVCTPSVNAELLPRFIGKRVRLLGEVEVVGDGIVMQVRAADKGLITVNMDRSPPLAYKIAEFVGTVVDGKTLKVESTTGWNETGVDFNNHNESIKHMHGAFAPMFLA